MAPYIKDVRKISGISDPLLRILSYSTKITQPPLLLGKPPPGAEFLYVWLQSANNQALVRLKKNRPKFHHTAECCDCIRLNDLSYQCKSESEQIRIVSP